VDHSALLSSKQAVDKRHLTASELAGYVDHALDADARRAAEEHLEQCAECRHEAMAIMTVADSYEANAPVVEVRARTAATSSARSRAGWRRVAIGSGVLAAGLVLSVVARQPNGRDEPIAAVRAPNTSARAGETVMAAAAPADGAAIPARGAVFSWYRTTTDTYRFTLVTQSGEPVWSRETSDTSVTLPAAVLLEPGHTYFWHVDAIADGIAATSVARRLLVAP
jgi:anti-sigma factor RsiW